MMHYTNTMTGTPQMGMTQMMGSAGRALGGLPWDPTIWEDIRSAMRNVVEQSAHCRKLLPHMIVPSDTTTVHLDRFHVKNGIGEVEQETTISLTELFAEFRLTAEQVERESTHHEGRSAAIQITRSMADAEDQMIIKGHFSSNLIQDRFAAKDQFLIYENGSSSASSGFLMSKIRAVVNRANPNFQSDLIKQVREGIASLRDNERYGPFAILMSPALYADAHATFSGTTRTPMEFFDKDIFAVEPVRGLHHTNGGITYQHAYLISLGANHADLVMPSDEYQVTFVRIDDIGKYVFRINHRFTLRGKIDNFVAAIHFPD